MKEQTTQVTTKLKKSLAAKLKRIANRERRTMKGVLEILLERVDEKFPLEYTD